MSHRFRFWFLNNILWPVQDAYFDVSHALRGGEYVSVVEIINRVPQVSLTLAVSPALRYEWMAKVLTFALTKHMHRKGYDTASRIVTPARADILMRGYVMFQEQRAEAAALAAEKDSA